MVSYHVSCSLQLIACLLHLCLLVHYTDRALNSSFFSRATGCFGPCSMYSSLHFICSFDLQCLGAFSKNNDHSQLTVPVVSQDPLHKHRSFAEIVVKI